MAGAFPIGSRAVVDSGWRKPPRRANRSPMLRQATTRIAIRSGGPGLHDFTPQAREFVANSGISDGLLTLFCRHTSASLLIQENAAPAARRDLERYFARLAPEEQERILARLKRDRDLYERGLEICPDCEAESRFVNEFCEFCGGDKLPF